MSLTMKSQVETAMVPPALVDIHDTIAIVAKVLLQSNKECVFVTSVGEVIGIITEHDLLRFLVKSQGMCSSDVEAEEIMTKPIITIPKSATLAEADEVMSRRNVNRLAVVKDANSLIVVGLIDGDMLHSQIKSEMLKTMKKRQKYVQK